MRFFTFVFLAMLLSCNSQQNKSDFDKKPGSFGYDLAFLQGHDSSLVILQNGPAKLIVSAKYQAKVLTSTAAGDGGASFGWIHYKAFDGPPDPHMNAYGGENRFWLGPEGGPYSLFFVKGAKMEFANWHTPAAVDSEPWELVNSTPTSVSLRKDMELANYAGTQLHCKVDRKISLLISEAVDSLLQIHLQKDVQFVAYRAENTVTNTGDKAWDDSTGMPCTWILDMFPPSDSTVIVIPYKPDSLREPATTDYFGEIPADRIKYKEGVLFFKADGKSRGKLGVHPAAAKKVAGSYDATKNVLTIILYDVDPLGKYLNQEWRMDKPIYSGDAMNAYNDGPLTNGSQMGPFYELESVSTAHFLPPGHSATHWHSVFHFTGDEAALNSIAQQVLGVSLDTIKNAFK